MNILAGRYRADDLTVVRALGPWLYSADERRIADYLLGNCCMILGHADPHVAGRIREEVGLGTNVGDWANRHTFPLAKRILRHARQDALRFVSSGSEAVHLAVRVARGATGKRLILKFEGHYHGWFREEFSAFVPKQQDSLGLGPDPSAAVRTLQWNDFKGVTDAFEKFGKELACVLCEPVLCHAGPIPPQPGFLELLRTLCTQAGVALIFDECITGFRLSLGGAQEFFGVDADLVTYSKALSGGIPLGVCAGRQRFMEVLEHGAYQAATYDGNPISLVAASAVLDKLEDPATYARIHEFGTRLMRAVTDIFDEHKIPHVLQGYPSVFQIFKTELDCLKTYREALGQTDIGFYSRLQEALLRRDVNVYKGDLRSELFSSWLSQWFVSAAHDGQVFEHTTMALRHAVKEALA
jgi:glutamate-1-semialdehyde 2,1-aminomutase